MSTPKLKTGFKDDGPLTKDERALIRGAHKILLLILLKGPDYGSSLARRCELSQPNTTSYYLPNLKQRGLVRCYEIGNIKCGNRLGGGRPAIEWELTKTGRRLAKRLKEHGW